MIGVFIFARGGSKGVPGKNMRMLGGVPLIHYSIMHAKAWGKADLITVSTDSDEIYDYALSQNVDALYRPAELCADDSPEWASWQHALEVLPVATFISLPCTTPFREVQDIEDVFDSYNRLRFDAVISTTNLLLAHKEVSEMRNGNIILNNDYYNLPRQMYPHTRLAAGSCYVVDPTLIKSASALWHGEVGFTVIPQERSLDIDTPYDFEVAEALMQLRSEIRNTSKEQ